MTEPSSKISSGSSSSLPWVFIVGCPRSGTTWMLDIFKQYEHAVTSGESSIFEILREPWWHTHKAPLYKRGRPVKEADKPGFRARVQDVAEKILIRNQPPWYGKWRSVFLSYFGDRTAFILNYSKLFPRPTIWSLQRGRLIPFWDFHALVAEAEAANLSSRDDRAAFITERMFARHIEKHRTDKTLALVEKTPNHLFHVEFLLERFPQTKVIEMVRDCRDVCVSMDFYKQWMPQNREFQIWQWNEYVKEGLKLRADERFDGRIHKVHYEDLRSNTPKTLTGIFDFLDLPATDESVADLIEATRIEKMKRRRPGQHYRKGKVGNWKEHLTEKDLEMIREGTAETFGEVGYSW